MNGRRAHRTAERTAAADMLGRVKSIAAQIQQSASGVAGSSTDPRLAAILAQLGALESRLTMALESPGAATLPIDLVTISALLSASETAATTILQGMAGETAGAAQEVAVTSAATRQEVETLARDLFGRRIFDPFLRFASDEEVSGCTATTPPCRCWQRAAPRPADWSMCATTAPLPAQPRRRRCSTTPPTARPSTPGGT